MAFRTRVVLRALLFFPSTFFHELSHLIVALLTGSKILSFSLIPRIEWENDKPTGVTFGYVRYVPLLPIAKIPVSFAPLLLLPAAWLMMKTAGISLEGWSLSFHYGGAKTVFCGYLAFQLLAASRPSSYDIMEAFDGLQHAAMGLASLLWRVLVAAGLACVLIYFLR